MSAEAEPKVVASDVADILRRRVKPEQEGVGMPIAIIAERAGTSEDTVLRVMQGRWETLSLKLADNLLVAADAHLNECELVWP